MRFAMPLFHYIRHDMLFAIAADFVYERIAIAPDCHMSHITRAFAAFRLHVIFTFIFDMLMLMDV